MKQIITIIKNCGTCPKWKKCSASKKLSKKEQMFFLLGVGMPLILEDCPLEDYKELTNGKNKWN